MIQMSKHMEGAVKNKRASIYMDIAIDRQNVWLEFSAS